MKSKSFVYAVKVSACVLGVCLSATALAERYDYAKFQLVQYHALPDGVKISAVRLDPVMAKDREGAFVVLPAYHPFDGFPFSRDGAVKFASYGPLPGGAYTFNGTVSAKVSVQLSDGESLPCKTLWRKTLNEHFSHGVLQQTHDMRNIIVVYTHGRSQKRVSCLLDGNPYK